MFLIMCWWCVGLAFENIVFVSVKDRKGRLENRGEDKRKQALQRESVSKRMGGRREKNWPFSVSRDGPNDQRRGDTPWPRGRQCARR